MALGNANRMGVSVKPHRGTGAEAGARMRGLWAPAGAGAVAGEGRRAPPPDGRLGGANLGRAGGEDSVGNTAGVAAGTAGSEDELRCGHPGCTLERIGADCR